MTGLKSSAEPCGAAMFFRALAVLGIVAACFGTAQAQSDVPELQVRNSGEIEVRFASGCTVLYNSAGRRINAGASCSRSQRNRADDAVDGYMREQSASDNHSDTDGSMSLRGTGSVTGGGRTTGTISSRNGSSYAVVISAAQDGYTCTGSFPDRPGSSDSMSTKINCTDGASGSAILTSNKNGYMLTFSATGGSGGTKGGFVRF